MTSSDPAEVFQVPYHDYECDGIHGSPAVVEHRWRDGRVDVLPTVCPAAEIPVESGLSESAELDARVVDSMWDGMPALFTLHELAADLFFIVGGEPEARSGLRAESPGSETVAVTAIRGVREQAQLRWAQLMGELDVHELELREDE